MKVCRVINAKITFKKKNECLLRHRSSPSISAEILFRSARHNADGESSGDGSGDGSDDRRWQCGDPTTEPDDYLASSLPPRHPSHRKSRFNDDSQPPIPSRRNFRSSSPGAAAAAEPASRNDLVLSPPRNLVETAHRRSISSSTCSLERLSMAGNEKELESSKPRGRRSVSVNAVPGGGRNLDMVVDEDVMLINSFLRKKRSLAARIVNRRLTANAKIVLSDSSEAS